MADLRFRTFRMKVYGRLCPQDVYVQERERFLRVLDEMDEDGVIAFFRDVPLNPQAARVFAILREAREIGDRLNAMDRTLPVLPHPEISGCYERLRSLGDEIEELLAGHVAK